MTRVKLVTDLFRAQDVDVRGKRVVDAAAEQLRHRCCLHIKVSNLRHGVNARIGPA
jgi:hypothetical protein